MSLQNKCICAPALPRFGKSNLQLGGTSQYKKRQKSNIDPSECRDWNPFDWIYKLSLLIGFFFRGIGEEEKMGEVVVVGSVAVVACVVPFDKSILIGWF